MTRRLAHHPNYWPVPLTAELTEPTVSGTHIELLSLSLSRSGSPLTSAPSSVETSTSTGSGDWLKCKGRDLSTSLFLSAGFLPVLRFPNRRPASPLWASQTCPEETRVGATAYHGMNSMGSLEPRNYWGGRGSQLVSSSSFFFFFFFFLILYLYFFFPKQNGASLPYRSWYWLCEYGGELVYMSRSMLAEFVSPF